MKAARPGVKCPRRVRRFRSDGSEFREARLGAGLDRKATAQLLRVTLRTVRNWERGATRPPYSAFKLMRILRCYELPGEAWAGWRLHGDTLWSPEQKPFRPYDLGWWGLTVSMARAWMRRYGAQAESVRVDVVLVPEDVQRPAIDPSYGNMAASHGRAGHPAALGDPKLALGVRSSPAQLRTSAHHRLRSPRLSRGAGAARARSARRRVRLLTSDTDT